MKRKRDGNAERGVVSGISMGAEAEPIAGGKPRVKKGEVTARTWAKWPQEPGRWDHKDVGEVTKRTSVKWL